VVGTASLSAEALAQRAAVAIVGFGARTIYNWYTILALAVAWGLGLWRRQLSVPARTAERLAFLAVVVVAILAVDVAGNIASPVGINGQIAQSTVRLLAQLAPVWMLLAAEMWSAVLNAKANDQEGAVISRAGRDNEAIPQPLRA
jgi:hypothetical protein